MLVSSTQPTLALDTREVVLALSCRVPLDQIPQRNRAGEWLELSFEDTSKRDLWIMLLETAFERADMDMLPMQPVTEDALPYPSEPSNSGRNFLLFTAMWLALVVAGVLALLGVFTR